MNRILLFCKDCEQNLEVYCDGHSAMICPNCSGIDSFDDPKCERCKDVEPDKNCDEYCENCYQVLAEEQQEQQFASYWGGETITMKERQREAQKVK